MRRGIGTLSVSLSIVLLLGAGGVGFAGGSQTEQAEPTPHGTKRVDGLEVTLLSSPPLSPGEIQRMMRGGGGMGGMMGGATSPGQKGMMGPEAPTHWIGVIVWDVSDDRVVQGADVTLMAKKGEITRTAKLMPMPSSYGANISLPEKGRYTITVSVARAGRPENVSFDFDYQ